MGHSYRKFLGSLIVPGVGLYHASDVPISFDFYRGEK